MEEKRGGAAAMTDAELSKTLGHYQTMSAVWLLAGVAGAIGGVISFFAVRDAALKGILTAVLFFGGICCAVFLRGGAQKKLNALMREQLGDFFRAEWEKAFGRETSAPELRIDEPLLKTLHLLDGAWEACTVERFHAGNHRGVHFSAANVRLDHVYRRGTPREGFETCTSTVFKGVVLRCEMRAPVSSPILVHARTEDAPRGVLTGDETFDRDFCVTADSEMDDARRITPQLIGFLTELDRSVEGRLLCACWEGTTFSLALETDFGVAAVASGVDLRDLDAVRRSYIKSLQEMGGLLDMLLESPALTAGA